MDPLQPIPPPRRKKAEISRPQGPQGARAKRARRPARGRLEEILISEVARVMTALAQGDLSQKMSLEAAVGPVPAEAESIAIVVNTVVDRLRKVWSEVTRVAKEVGTEGKLGGQAQVPEVAGAWRDLTDNVNLLAGNLTS